MLIAALVESWQTADAGDAGGWDDDSETGDEVLLSWDTSEESVSKEKRVSITLFIATLDVNMA